MCVCCLSDCATDIQPLNLSQDATAHKPTHQKGRSVLGSHRASSCWGRASLGRCVERVAATATLREGVAVFPTKVFIRVCRTCIAVAVAAKDYVKGKEDLVLK